MPNPNNLVKVRARTPRFRTRPLMQSTRRNEVKPTQLSYPVGDTRRSALSPRDGNRDEAWTTLGLGTAETRATRHPFPYSVTGPDLSENLASTWDYPLNSTSLMSQIDPATAGRGIHDPTRAGSDLAARIWSVKTWSIAGTIWDHDIEQTVAAGNSLSVTNSGGTETRTETPTDSTTGRRFSPTHFSYLYSWLSDEEDDDSSVNFTIGITWPYGVLSTAETGFFWSRGANLGAGMSGDSIILAPVMIGGFTYFVYDAGGDISAQASYSISPWRIWPTGSEAEMYEVASMPLFLCGYQIKGNESPGKIGGSAGELRIKAEEFWGPDEWPA